MLTIGVLGANGFVGSRIVEKLHLEGTANVIPIVRNYAGLVRASRFSLDARLADALDYAALIKAFAGCDVVVNAALGPIDQIAKQPPVIYPAAEAAGVRRLIHISTASVHGQDPEPGSDETSALRTDQPVPYNNAKVKAERRFQALRRRGRVELVTLRPGIVFGPRDIWISSIAHSIVCGEAYLVDGGRGICNTIYIDNLIHAITLCFTADVDGDVFLLGDREMITWAEVYHWVAAALDDCAPVKIVSDPPIAYPKRTPPDQIRVPKILKPMFRPIPKPVKAFVRRELRIAADLLAQAKLAHRTARMTEWVLRDDSIGPVPLETALLHRCRYKFPFARAQQRLGYEPPVSLEDGLIRSIRSLRFAGLTINPAFTEMRRSARFASQIADGVVANPGVAAPTTVEPAPPAPSPAPVARSLPA